MLGRMVIVMFEMVSMGDVANLCALDGMFDVRFSWSKTKKAPTPFGIGALIG